MGKGAEEPFHAPPPPSPAPSCGGAGTLSTQALAYATRSQDPGNLHIPSPPPAAGGGCESS